ncbi:MAG: ABC transporter permease [Ignavibacteriaceae bacterium]|nr:ABC transporter permease [Ignavibacteriaceae bacterium]
MKFLIFLTTRFIRSSGNSRDFSVFSVISATGIALGVATLIIALSVLQGFENTLEEKMTGFEAHLQITGFSNRVLSDYELTASEIYNIAGDRIKFINPVAGNLAVAGRKKLYEGIYVKGVEEKYFSLSSGIRLSEGRFFMGDEKNEIVLGKSLATKLLLKTGDKINLFAIDNTTEPDLSSPPNIMSFTVVGIYESGMARYDNSYAFMSKKIAQELFSLGNAVNSIEIKLNSLEGLDSLKNLLQDKLPYPNYVRSFKDTYRHIFNWIELQKKPIPIVLALIILVATFNIISTLLTLILEKSNSIGVLKTLGASSRSITGIFALRGILISAGGIIAGNLLALLLIFIQIQFDIIKIPGDVYFITKTPFYLGWEIFAGVSAITLPLAMVLSILPGYIASKLDPVKTLRFD